MASTDALGKLLSTQEAPTHPELEKHMLNYKIFLKTLMSRDQCLVLTFVKSFNTTDCFWIASGVISLIQAR